MGKKNDILAVKGFRLSVYHSEYLWNSGNSGWEGLFLEKFILNSVMGSGIFLNPSYDEADQLRSLIIGSALGHDEWKSKLMIIDMCIVYILFTL